MTLFCSGSYFASRGNDFRPSYRRLGHLRSFLRKDVNFVALTATATGKIKAEVCQSLLMQSPSTICMSSERFNIFYEVLACRPGDSSFLDWVVDTLRRRKQDALKAIIYCRNVSTVSTIYQYLSLALGKDQFCGENTSFDNKLFAMFHRATDDENKTLVLNEFKKPDSVIRVVIATTSFEMGLNFPDVSLIVNFSVPRSLESFAQQSGRGGRGIAQSFSLIVHHGAIGKGMATDEMKRYAEAASVCRRKLLRDHFHLCLNESKDIVFSNATTSPKGCHCCDICRKGCDCGNCLSVPWKLPVGLNEDTDEPTDDLFDDASLSSEKMELLKERLDEYRHEIYEPDYGITPDSLSFWENVEYQILISCDFILSIDDLIHETQINDITLANHLWDIIDETRSG